MSLKIYKYLLTILLLNLVNISASLAEPLKTITAVNFLTDQGLLYSYTKLNEYGNPLKPTIKKMNDHKWGIHELVQTRLNKNLAEAEELKTIPLDQELFNKYALASINQVMEKEDLPRKIIEKLAKLGRKQQVDYIYAVFPAKGEFAPPTNSQWVATPPGLAIMYVKTDIWVGLSVWHYVIDVKKRSVIAEKKLQDFRKVKLPARTLFPDQIASVKKWINEDIKDENDKLKDSDVDFSRPLTEADIDVLYSKVTEENQDNIQLLDILLNPLHHTLEEFEQQPEAIMTVFKEAIQQAAIEPIDGDVGDVLYIALTPDDDW